MSKYDWIEKIDDRLDNKRWRDTVEYHEQTDMSDQLADEFNRESIVNGEKLTKDWKDRIVKVDGLFIHIPKTGGSSCYKCLQPDVIKSDAKHETALVVKDRILELFDEDEWNRLYKVAWVRNPWQRAVSLWKYTRKMGIPKHGINDFKVWLFDPKVAYHCEDEPYNRSPLTALTYVSDLDGNIIVDFFGRLEHINEDMEKLGKKLNKNFKLGHHMNHSFGDGYERYYDNESREYVAEICKWEIETFNYNFKIKQGKLMDTIGKNYDGGDIKFTQEELDLLTKFQQTQDSIIKSLGSIKVQRLGLQAKEEELNNAENQFESQYIENQNKQKEFVQSISKKYGDGNLDLTTGVFTPAQVEKTE